MRNTIERRKGRLTIAWLGVGRGSHFLVRDTLGDTRNMTLGLNTNIHH
jgi:hypothetical protein